VSPRDRADRFQPTQQTNTPNYAVAFRILKPFNERHRSAKEIAADIQATSPRSRKALPRSEPAAGPRSRPGAGYSLFVEDRAGAGYGALQQAANALQGVVVKDAGMGFSFVGYQSNVPTTCIQVDRVKARPGRGPHQPVRDAPGLSRLVLCQRLQPVRPTWRVYAQAEWRLPQAGGDIANLKTRNDKGEIGPDRLDGEDQPTYGPIRCCATTAIRRPTSRRGQSSHAVLGAGDGHDGELARRVLPNGMTIEWTDLSFQEATQGNAPCWCSRSRSACLPGAGGAL